MNMHDHNINITPRPQNYPKLQISSHLWNAAWKTLL